MLHNLSVNYIINSFLYPTLPKHPGKLDYEYTIDTHHLLTGNAALIESPCKEVKNGHLRIVLMAKKYALVSQVPLFL